MLRLGTSGEFCNRDATGRLIVFSTRADLEQTSGDIHGLHAG